MKKRVIVVLLISVLLLLIVVGCNPAQATKVEEPVEAEGEETAEPAELTEEEPYKVVISAAFYTAPFIAAFRESAEERAVELGIDLQIVDGERDQTKQLEQAKLAKATADAFIYFPADIPGAKAIFDELGDFPYIVVNNYDTAKLEEDGVPCFIGADVSRGAYVMTDLLTQIFPDKKANLVKIQGVAGHFNTTSFDNGFEETFKGTEFVWLDQQNADFDSDKALTKMTDMLTKYGDEIEGIVVYDGGMTKGVLAALKAADLLGEIPVVAYGSNQLLYDGIMDGSIYGTATQDPVAEGVMVMDAIKKILDGEEVELWEVLPMEPATKENADEFGWF